MRSYSLYFFSFTWEIKIIFYIDYIFFIYSFMKIMCVCVCVCVWYEFNCKKYSYLLCFIISCRKYGINMVRLYFFQRWLFFKFAIKYLFYVQLLIEWLEVKASLRITQFSVWTCIYMYKCGKSVRIKGIIMYRSMLIMYIPYEDKFI